VHWQPDALTTRLDLIRTRLDLISLRMLKIYELPGSNQLGGHLSQLELVVLRLRERLPKLFPNLNYAELQYLSTVLCSERMFQPANQ
jgi:hypothetical protein